MQRLDFAVSSIKDSFDQFKADILTSGQTDTVGKISDAIFNAATVACPNGCCPAQREISASPVAGGDDRRGRRAEKFRPDQCEAPSPSNARTHMAQSPERTMSSISNSITGTGRPQLVNQIDHLAQTGSLLDVALVDVAVDDADAVLADAGQEGLDLGDRGILRLVEQDEGVLPGAPAHHLERHHFDVAAFQGDFERPVADALLDGVRDRHGPGREFVLKRAGEEAERTAARHVGTGEDDFFDFLGAIEIGGVGGGKPGFSGAGGAEDDDLRAGSQGGEILRLGGIEGLYGWKDTIVLELVSFELDDLGISVLTGIAGSLSVQLLAHALTPRI